MFRNYASKYLQIAEHLKQGQVKAAYQQLMITDDKGQAVSSDALRIFLRDHKNDGSDL
jgi:hypothetical protein